ncbi:PREDICTED: turripeptide Lol9.1-like [Branchiostoma belcheri]|uniref:Turripeptide Lol9.1-like n=1 Tax=Branchiostoma belcheri TaxID=7741 RepID=A0A6P4ZZ43_BRABE|nr:PREDICTED: turripeptide Lol9.1-like [Branchiostoma belcheri]
MKTAMVVLFAGLVIAVALLSSAEGRSLSRRPPSVDLRDCPLLCPAVYSPVCGSNGQVYSNLCHLNVAKCLTADPNLTEAPFSECDSGLDLGWRAPS